MKRRQFVLGGLMLSAGALLEAPASTRLNSYVAGILDGAKKVRNARATPPFTTRSFSSSSCIRFCVIGDWGSGAKFQRRVAASLAAFAAKEKPQFILSTGDNIYPDGVQSESDPQFATKWKNVYSASSLQIPWYLALGNHDHRQSAEAQVKYSAKDPLWKMPSTYFSFTQKQGNVEAEFFILDTDDLIHANSAAQRKQLDWLQQSLQKSGATWKIAAGHHPVRSYGEHGEHKLMVQLVKPILDKYKVPLYLCGHDHDLQLIKHPTDSFRCAVSGGGGGARDTGYGEHSLFAATNGGFVFIAIDHKKLYLEYVDSNSKTLFTNEISA